MDQYRAYCAGCCNFKALRRYPGGLYLCARCARKLDALGGNDHLSELQAVVPSRKKTTEREYRRRARGWQAMR